MTNPLIAELELLLELAKAGKVDAVMMHYALQEERMTPDDAVPAWSRISSFMLGEMLAVHSFIHQLGPAIVPFMHDMVSDIDQKTGGLTTRRAVPGASYN